MPLQEQPKSIAELVALEIHTGNPREGPGSLAATRQAFSALHSLPYQPRILDIGCGPGQQSLELAKISGGVVTALDIHPPFLRALESRAQEEGLTSRLRTVQASMDSIDLPPNSFDLLWSEGSVYIIGFRQGLTQWRRLLQTGGWLVASHLSWLKADIPAEPKQFWDQHFPEIAPIEENLKLAEAHGYSNESHFVLPPEAWWNEYYTPIESKLKLLRQKYLGSLEAQYRIDQMQREIDLYRSYSDYYGYVFYLLRVGGIE